MVDLGFLLITFFMYTTTMAKPKKMEIVMPVSHTENPNEVKSVAAMTIILSGNHRVYYYKGIGSDAKNPPRLMATNFRMEGGIRDAIMDMKRSVEQLQRRGILSTKDKATVLIRPDKTSTYEDLVSILDEMAITDARVYAVVDMTAQDKEFIALTERANGLR